MLMLNISDVSDYMNLLTCPIDPGLDLCLRWCNAAER